jgi:branched-subunit amino acid transport protein
MTSVTLALVIAGLTLVTVVTRSLFLVLGERVPLPERVRHGLRYAPACALAALILPQLVLNGQGLDIAWLNPRLDAGILTVLVMLWSRNMLAAMSAGMAAFLLMRALL